MFWDRIAAILNNLYQEHLRLPVFIWRWFIKPQALLNPGRELDVFLSQNIPTGHRRQGSLPRINSPSKWNQQKSECSSTLAPKIFETAQELKMGFKTTFSLGFIAAGRGALWNWHCSQIYYTLQGSFSQEGGKDFRYLHSFVLQVRSAW